MLSLLAMRVYMLDSILGRMADGEGIKGEHPQLEKRTS